MAPGLVDTAGAGLDEPVGSAVGRVAERCTVELGVVAPVWLSCVALGVAAAVDVTGTGVDGVGVVGAGVGVVGTGVVRVGVGVGVTGVVVSGGGVGVVGLGVGV